MKKVTAKKYRLELLERVVETIENNIQNFQSDAEYSQERLNEAVARYIEDRPEATAEEIEDYKKRHYANNQITEYQDKITVGRKLIEEIEKMA